MGPIEAGILERYAGVRERLLMPTAPPPRPAVVRQQLTSPFAQTSSPRTPGSYFVNLLTPPSWKVIAGLVALKHGFRTGQIEGPEKTREHVAARDEAMKLLSTHMGMSLPAIGRHFNRDHTSVLHSLRKAGIGPQAPKGAQWTPEMDRDLIRLWCERVSFTEIAFVVGVSRNSAIARVVKLGLPRRDGKARSRASKRAGR